MKNYLKDLENLWYETKDEDLRLLILSARQILQRINKED
jgi:hypothetical protein